MKEESLRKDLSDNALEFSKAYSSEAVAEEVLDVYYESIVVKKMNRLCKKILCLGWLENLFFIR
jgi:hypothetical protein